jgi:protein gp37
MAQNSKIEWTHHTANLWHGCTKVHEGCDNCYAETLSKRWGNDIWGNDKPRKEIKSVWNELLKMQKLAKQGEMHRVFVGSMMDIFENPMPIIDANIPEYTTGVLRNRFFDHISSGWYPNLTFLLLTKRPSNINKMIPELWKTNPPKNVMFGTSPVNQKTFDTLTRQLLEVNGLRFLSVEPQLDKIELNYLKGIDWIIQGGESGHDKRPFDLEWARKMKAECSILNIPYFFKQIDKIKEIPTDLQVRMFPKEQDGRASM